MRARPCRVVIAVENLPVDRDLRARQIARSLARAGFDVCVICPRSEDPAARRSVDGVRVSSFPTLPFDRLGLPGHILEYAWCCSAIAAMLVVYRVRGRVDIAHLCVPPHVLCIGARVLRLLGCRIVIDQHDLMPELFVARYGERHRLLYRAVVATERAAVRSADFVLAANESGARAAVGRAGASPDRVRVVRTGPFREETERLRHVLELESDGRPTVVGYVGNIERQDGVDLLVDAARHVVDELGSTAVRFVCIGGGNDLGRLRALARDIGVDDVVEFTGRLTHRDALRRLGACDICVQPDPRNDFNDTCTMIKSLEYMALAKPIVAFDLAETRAACAGAALYASQNSPEDFAAKIVALVRDPNLRRRLGSAGAERIDTTLAWEFGEAALLAAYADPVLDGRDRGSPREDGDTGAGRPGRRRRHARGAEARQDDHDADAGDLLVLSNAGFGDGEHRAPGVHPVASARRGSQLAERTDVPVEGDSQRR